MNPRKIFELIESENYKLVSTVEYQNKDTKIPLICPKGHAWGTTWGKWQNGYRCFECNASKKKTIEEIDEFLISRKESLISKVYENAHSPLIIKCDKGHEYNTKWNKIQSGYGCPRCNESMGQAQVSSWLENLGIQYITNDNNTIKGMELDIYIPNKKLAIEYNGLYYHSEKFRGNTYHLNKLKTCLNNDIQLIQIFDYEWKERNAQVKNFIASKLGLNKPISARKTKFVEVDKKFAADFLKEYHILGSCSAENYYALTINMEIYMMIAIGKHHRQTSNEVILKRLCTKAGFTIVGGLSKILSHIPHKRIITYADRRFSEGNVYIAVGFKIKENTRPDYFYMKGIKHFSKQLLKKNKAEQTSGMSEAELRSAQGYLKVWDCGKKVFVYDKSE